jgi:hypothetical protein
MPKTDKELIEIANDLSNNDLCKLLNLTSNRIMVSIGSYQNNSITINDIECNTNGSLIQINPADKGIDNTFNLEKHINNINGGEVEVDFCEDKMDNMLREQDLDWTFDKPLHKNYTKLYIKKNIHNGDTDNDSSDSDLF